MGGAVGVCDVGRGVLSRGGVEEGGEHYLDLGVLSLGSVEDVLRLEIAVDNLELVQVAERLQKQD